MRNYAELKGHLLSDLGFYLCSQGLDETYLEGPTTSDLTETVVAVRSLAASFYKKLLPTGDSRVQDEAALKKFRAVNQKTREFSGFVATSELESTFWDYLRDNFRRGLEHTWETQYDQIQDVSSWVYTGFDPSKIAEYMNVGPGASQRADSRTMATKLFTGPISYCGDDHLITLYRGALANTGLWADAEMRRSPMGFVRVKGGQLFFAKKNAEISRTCCTEPLLNMLIQKSVGGFIEERIRRQFKIDLKTQQVLNRELAKVGSVDGSFGTIDLVSASDSTSILLFNELCQESFLKWATLESSCRFAVLPDGEEVELGMLSTMGNGFTFQLMTYIFACVVRSVYQMMGFPCSDPSKHFGVFGDDIIVRREAYSFVCQMLTKLGYEVNDGKSFNVGPFRESCGGDYYSGHDVRGVYVASLETPQHVCSVINRLNRWSAHHGVDLPATISWLWDQDRLPLTPPDTSDDAGVHVPFLLSAPNVDGEYRFKYPYFSKIVKKMVLEEPDDDLCPNPEGYGLSFLSGHTRRPDGELFSAFNGVRVSLRDPPEAVSRYRVRRGWTHYWDYPNACRTGDRASHERWMRYMTVTFG